MPRTKKTIKKETRRAAPVVSAPEPHACPCGCGCHHGKFKKFVVLLIVFLLGFAVAKMTSCRGPHMHGMPKIHPVFQNGCLVMDSIKCPKMVEALQNADADANGCISKEEFRTVKRQFKKGMPRPDHMPKPEHMPEPEQINM